MKGAIISVLLALAAPLAARAETSCDQLDLTSFIATESAALPPARFAGISTDLTVPEIVRRLGPAARNVGSGLHVLEWDSLDGRIFRVGSASLCDKPLYARFDEARIQR